MTPFGKDMRHLRIDRGMLLGDMAEVLQVSSDISARSRMANDLFHPISKNALFAVQSKWE